MSGQIEKLNVDLVSRGCVDPIAQHLLTLWNRSRGIIDHHNIFAGVSPHFVRLSGNIPDQDSPEILFVGRNSLLGREIKESKKASRDRRLFFEPGYRRAMSRSYLEALDTPALHTVQDAFNPDRGPAILTYDRITLPWRTVGGQLFLISYSKLLDKLPATGPSNPEHCSDYLLRQPGRRLSSLEEHPSEAPFRVLAQSRNQADIVLPNRPD